MEWNGMDWNGLEWIGMEWTGMDWNGMEYWNRMALSVDFAIIVAVIRPVNR